jgi:predicted protein tyrosine phosphatase
MRVLFICSRNRLRSPTAEEVFSAWPGVETDSAGIAPDAEVPVSAEQIGWADIVFVMERVHKARLTQRYGASLKGKKIVCLDIPDLYAYMQPELVAILERKVQRHLD